MPNPGSGLSIVDFNLADQREEQGRGVDPRTGHNYDDTKRYIDQVSWLSAADKRKIFEDNAKKVYPRLKGKI